MNRKKVIELARKAGLAYGSDEKPLSSVERFAALIEAEVCGDAEPVAWMSPKKERLEFSRADTVYGSHTIPLYAHPNPPVVAQLVEALQSTEKFLDRVYDNDIDSVSFNLLMTQIIVVEQALDTAKGAGYE